MAKGNWNPNVINPKTRCRYCGYVLKKKEIRYVGYVPCHAECANKRNLVHAATQPKTAYTRYLSEEEPTGKITITHEEAMRVLSQRGLTQRALDFAGTCREITHFYVDGVCAHCGQRKPQSQ